MHAMNKYATQRGQRTHNMDDDKCMFDVVHMHNMDTDVSTHKMDDDMRAYDIDNDIHVHNTDNNLYSHTTWTMICVHMGYTSICTGTTSSVLGVFRITSIPNKMDNDVSTHNMDDYMHIYDMYYDI